MTIKIYSCLSSYQGLGDECGLWTHSPFVWRTYPYLQRSPWSWASFLLMRSMIGAGTETKLWEFENGNSHPIGPYFLMDNSMIFEMTLELKKLLFIFNQLSKKYSYWTLPCSWAPHCNDQCMHKWPGPWSFVHTLVITVRSSAAG